MTNCIRCGRIVFSCVAKPYEYRQRQLNQFTAVARAIINSPTKELVKKCWRRHQFWGGEAPGHVCSTELFLQDRVARVDVTKPACEQYEQSTLPSSAD